MCVCALCVCVCVLCVCVWKNAESSWFWVMQENRWRQFERGEERWRSPVSRERTWADCPEEKGGEGGGGITT